MGDRVLLTSTPTPSSPTPDPVIFIHCNKEPPYENEWVWIFVDEKDTERLVRTPKLADGWHSMAIVSSQESTTFYLDGTDFQVKMPNIWLRNNFYMVGNNGPVPLSPKSQE